MCSKASAAPMVHLDSFPHCLYLPYFAVHRIKAEANLRYPECRAKTTADEVDRKTLQQYTKNVVTQAFTNAR